MAVDDVAAEQQELDESLSPEISDDADELSGAEEPMAGTSIAGAEDDDLGDDTAASADDDPDEGEQFVAKRSWRAPVLIALAVGVTAVLALSALGTWLYVLDSHSRSAESRRQSFLQAGRQGALNLTTIDYQHVDGDIQRILDSATGVFYDDFSKRSTPFIEVVKQAQAKSVGTITEAGLESESDHDAQVLVAVNVKTSNAGAEEQEPRSWRMRIAVTQVGGDVKVGNVQFVP
jgi:Mce-associated membrane protein